MSLDGSATAKFVGILLLLCNVFIMRLLASQSIIT